MKATYEKPVIEIAFVAVEERLMNDPSLGDQDNSQQPF